MAVNSYQIRNWCHPRGDLRLEEIREFLKLLANTFRCECFYDSQSREIELTDDFLRRRFKRQIARQRRKYPRLYGPSELIGVNDDFFTVDPKLRSDQTSRIEISTGHDPQGQFIDKFDICLSHEIPLPKVCFLKRIVKLFGPFESRIEESWNMRAIGWYERSRAVRPQFKHPAFICGTHYFSKELAEPLGGVEFCLKAPAYKVELFEDGVWMQLCESGWLDQLNPDDWRVQKEVMQYLGIW